jgi:UDP-N-acetylglucosamine 4-epimerase
MTPKLYDVSTTFLVTGGAGFIGSNLVEAILERGAKVRVLDDFSTGELKNIASFQHHPNFTLLKGSVEDQDLCQTACRDVDFVLHHAALASVPKSIEDPHLTNAINVNGTLNMLIAARDKNVKRFIYASSSAVYGDQKTSPQIEGCEGETLSPYALSKKINELYSAHFNKIYGLQTIGLRYFNVFGKRQNSRSIYAAVIPIFVEKILKGEAPIIFGDGLQTRDFTHIDNVVEANLKACAAPVEACGKVFNIAFGEPSTLTGLYEMILQRVNKSINPIYQAAREGDIKHSVADITKAIDVLNYRPKISLIDGLKKSIEWYQQNL